MAYSYSIPKKVYRKKDNSKKLLDKRGVQTVYRTYSSNVAYKNLLYTDPEAAELKKYTDYRKHVGTYKWVVLTYCDRVYKKTSRPCVFKTMYYLPPKQYFLKVTKGILNK